MTGVSRTVDTPLPRRAGACVSRSSQVFSLLGTPADRPCSQPLITLCICNLSATRVTGGKSLQHIRCPKWQTVVHPRRTSSTHTPGHLYGLWKTCPPVARAARVYRRGRRTTWWQWTRVSLVAVDTSIIGGSGHEYHWWQWTRVSLVAVDTSIIGHSPLRPSGRSIVVSPVMSTLSIASRSRLLSRPRVPPSGR